MVLYFLILELYIRYIIPRIVRLAENGIYGRAQGIIYVLDEHRVAVGEETFHIRVKFRVREFRHKKVLVFHFSYPFVGLQLGVDGKGPAVAFGGENGVLLGTFVAREPLHHPFPEEHGVAEGTHGDVPEGGFRGRLGDPLVFDRGLPFAHEFGSVDAGKWPVVGYRADGEENVAEQLLDDFVEVADDDFPALRLVFGQTDEFFGVFELNFGSFFLFFEICEFGLLGFVGFYELFELVFYFFEVPFFYSEVLHGFVEIEVEAVDFFDFGFHFFVDVGEDVHGLAEFSDIRDVGDRGTDFFDVKIGMIYSYAGEISKFRQKTVFFPSPGPLSSYSCCPCRTFSAYS